MRTDIAFRRPSIYHENIKTLFTQQENSPLAYLNSSSLSDEEESVYISFSSSVLPYEDEELSMIITLFLDAKLTSSSSEVSSDDDSYTSKFVNDAEDLLVTITLDSGFGVFVGDFDAALGCL